MNVVKRGRGIRWKLVFIYVLLVFIATTIIGVFIMKQLETYYVNSTRINMTNTVQEGTLITSLNSYKNLWDHREEIQGNIDAWAKSLQQEIFVVDDSFIIVASNNANQGKSAVDLLDQNIILRGLSGEVSESEDTIRGQNKSIPVMNMVFPIGKDDKVTGVLYLRSDMSSVAATIDQSKIIFVKAMLIAVAVTIILGFLISKSITEPINDVTEKAKRMAQGDFSQE
ncbi:MAG: hypothetical protein RR361_05905, partial [Anaerovorax sp.]